MPKFVDLTGQRFGRLTVLHISGKDSQNKYLWKCRCDCGNEKVVGRGSLKTGDTSCGCAQAANARLQLSKVIRNTHNKTKSLTYVCWKNMKARCDDINHKSFSGYGGRGITYTPRWNLFENFYEDMGEMPVGLSLNRVDVNLGYCKDNCEWADSRKQARDRRKQENVSSDYKGVCYCALTDNYKGYLHYDGIYHHLGYSKDPRELALRYDSLVRELTGGDFGTNLQLGLIN